MKKYPLCEKAGLRTHRGPSPRHYVINAADVEKFLEGAPVVYGMGSDKNGSLVYGDGVKPDGDWEIQARLVMIEPIKPKSLEDKIKDLLDNHALSANCTLAEIRKLLESK